MKICFACALLLTLAIFACRRASDPIIDGSSPVRLALLVAYDVSKTYRHIPAPDAGTLKEMALTVARTGGCIAFTLIGTPDSTGQFVRAYFKSPPPYPGAGATYLSQIRYRHVCDSMERYNGAEIERFMHRCLTILNVRKLHQHSDLNGLLSAADHYFHEAGVADCQPLVYLASDGLQDVRLTTRIDTVLQPSLLTRSDAKVYYSGWKNQNLPHNWKPLESYEGIVHEISFTSQ